MKTYVFFFFFAFCASSTKSDRVNGMGMEPVYFAHFALLNWYICSTVWYVRMMKLVNE